MIAETTTSELVPIADEQDSRVLWSTPFWERSALVAILALTTFLDFFRIDQNGFDNTYYAVTVRSMSLSWHNWFFASFDPGGFITVDKPPLGFWLQVLSVKLFGYHGFAVILPQAIAGVASVFLIYLIIRRVFDGPAALISALVLALSPINVVSNRDNILESLLVTFVLAATLAVTIAIEQGSLQWLLAAGVLIGLGFNIKMLEAYLVVPALGVAYLLAAPVSWRTRIVHLVAAGALMVTVSFAWVEAVDLTPAASRPYIGSSYHNSETDLAFAYNGLQRLSGTPWSQVPVANSPRGAPGPLRLFISNLNGQIAWLMPLALIILVATLYQPWRKLWRIHNVSRFSPQESALALWGVWLITMLVFFSVAIFFNSYYLAMLSPAIAALTGIGITMLWSALFTKRWERWLLPAGVCATAFEQLIILALNQTWDPWLLPVVIVVAGCAIAVLLVVAAAPQFLQRFARIARVATALLLGCALGLAPLLWTLSSLHRDALTGAPASGPSTGAQGTAVTPTADPRLVAYLRQHTAGAAFLVATIDTGDATPIIFSTGAPVMAMGGYTSFDPILTPVTLAMRIARNDVRYFYLPSSNLTQQQMRQIYPKVRNAVTKYTNVLTQWVAQHCIAVPPLQWSATNGTDATRANAMQLFDCSLLTSG